MSRVRVPYVHGYEDDAARDHRRVVHRVLRNRAVRRERKDDGHDERPRDARDVHRPAERPIAEVERTRLEAHLGVVPKDAAERDRDHVRDVERHRGQREDRVRRDGRGKVEQAREDAEDRREPDGAQRRVRPLGDAAKVALVRETYMRVFFWFQLSLVSLRECAVPPTWVQRRA
jgi:hypothetical protein